MVKNIIGYPKDELLFDMIAKHQRIQLACKQPNGWQIQTGTFQSCLFEKSIECNLEPTLDSSQGAVGVRFQLGHKSILFESKYIEDYGGVWTSLTWPKSVRFVSRIHFRLAVPHDVITAQIREANGDEIHGQLNNLSLSGMLVTTAKKCKPGEYTLCIQETQPIVVEGILIRSEPTDTGRFSCFFQFVGLEFDKETVARIIKTTNQYKKRPRQQSPSHRYEYRAQESLISGTPP